MDDLDRFIKNARSLSAKKLIVEAAGPHTDELADLNVTNMEQGLMSNGKNISPEYQSSEYAEYKSSIGSISSPTPDLKLTGDFHEGVFAKISGENIEFGSTDEKESDLQRQYTDDIFGVQEDQLEEVIDETLVGIIDKKLMNI